MRYDKLTQRLVILLVVFLLASQLFLIWYIRFLERKQGLELFELNQNIIHLEKENSRLKEDNEQLQCNPFYYQEETMLLDPFCERPVQSQGYGKTKWKEAYGGMGLGGHPGVDWAAPEGEPIRASHSGTVFAAFDGHDNAVDGKKGYGNRVKIRTRDGRKGYETVYAHLSKVYVKVGERVSRGQLIGLNGDTGFSSRPHLHFGIRFLWFCDDTDQIEKACEVLDGGNGMLGWVDPTPYLP